MKLSLVSLASSVGRWLAPAALAAATLVGSVGVSRTASAQERFRGGPPAVAPGPRGVVPGPRGVVGGPGWGMRHRRFWGPGVVPGRAPWGHWRSPGFRGGARPFGGYRGFSRGGGGFHGGGGFPRGGRGGGGFHGGRH